MGNPNIKNWGFGSPGRSKEFDDEVRRKGLEARKNKPRLWTDENIAAFIDEMLTLYKQILMDSRKISEGSPKKLKQETIRDMNTMMRRLLDFKEKFYPPVQKNINVNINTTADKVIERIKEYKLEQEGVVVTKEKEVKKDVQKDL